MSRLTRRQNLEFWKIELVIIHKWLIATFCYPIFYNADIQAEHRVCLVWYNFEADPEP